MTNHKKPGAPARLKIATLKPRVGIADLSIARPLQPSNAGRMRGRRLQALRKRWFAANPLCCLCEQRGVTTLATELDHKLALFLGGRDVDENRWGLCAQCHRDKTDRELRGERGL